MSAPKPFLERVGITSYRIWDIDSGKLALKPESITSDLLSKSGMNQKLVRYNKMLKDLEDPNKAYIDYYNDVAKDAEIISTTIISDYNDLVGLGIDSDSALKTAQSKAENSLQQQIALQNLKHPISQNFEKVYEGRRGKATFDKSSGKTQAVSMGQQTTV